MKPPSRLILAAALAAALAACGGSETEGVPTPTTAPKPPAQDVKPPSPPPPPPPPPPAKPPTPPIQPPQPQPLQPTTFCGYEVGPHRLHGRVTEVHDGDTLRVGGVVVRLDSIDAPELAQQYGDESRRALSALRGQSVTVAYAKWDRYGRVVGSVFTSDCGLVNLQQVADGNAWYYEAYRCEISAQMRQRYAVAQEEAIRRSLGLWRYRDLPTHQAPWVFRGGQDKPPPTCNSDLPRWPLPEPGSTPPSTPPTPDKPTTPPKPPTYTPPTTPAPAPPKPPTYTPPSRNCTPYYVPGYTRRNGTRVRGHYRRPPGCA